MSMPKISDINPTINIVRDDAINILIASIGMEELAIAHILNAEGEKLQYVLGTLEGADPGEITICDIMAVNNSVHKTLRDVIKAEMLLQLKLENAIELSENTGECQLTIRGQKTWRDSNNIIGIRPPSVDITLLRDGEVFRTTTIDSTGDGTYTFSCLPVWRDAENRYTYQVDEAVTPTGYRKTVDGYNITNTINQGSITISGTKTWVDYNNVEQLRPENITVTLLQNGGQPRTAIIESPPDENNTAPINFVNVPQFDDEGNLYVYTLDETIVPGYTTTIDNYNITNTIQPILITIEGSKEWDDAADETQRPVDGITVYLLQNDVQFRETTIASPPQGEYSRPFSFTNVPKYDSQGVEYIYTVNEADIAGYDINIDATTNTITNTLL